MQLENGKWYWILPKNHSKSIPAMLHMRAFETALGAYFSESQVQIIRPLEDPPEPPLENGWYWVTYPGREGKNTFVVEHINGEWYNTQELKVGIPLKVLNKIDGPITE